MPALQFVAILSAILFSGAALYISLVEHPALMECGSELAAAVFGPSYRRAAVMQVILALSAAVGGTGVWLMRGPSVWLVGALLIFAVIPFTLTAVRPVTQKLLDPGLERGSEEARRLLEKWGKLHAVRSILGLLTSTTFVCSVI